MVDMAKTLKELAIDAMRVQDACNLRAVVNGFSRALGDLDKLCKGDAERDNHPIARIWADKVAHLTGTQNYGVQDQGDYNLSQAYSAVHELAEAD